MLYDREGREQERDFWLKRAERHRLANPYYHAWQGDQAAAGGDWRVALAHYNRALGLAPRDSHLLFGRGIIYYQLSDYDAASADISRAIELATRRSEIENYRLQLDQVRRAALAGV
jgi:Flp pilus assembly protein TadD